jgi:hypothetical protein
VPLDYSHIGPESGGQSSHVACFTQVIRPTAGI